MLRIGEKIKKLRKAQDVTLICTPKVSHDYKSYYEAVIKDERFPMLRKKVEEALEQIKESADVREDM